MALRVALVVPDLRRTSGGLAQNLPRLAEALADVGVEVQLHAIGEVPASTRPNLRYRGAAPVRPIRIGRSPELRANLLSSEAQVVHANGLWMLPLGYAARAARRLGVPLVVGPRGMLAAWALRRSRWKKALARLVLHPGALDSAAGWHATSDREAEDIRRLGFRQPICVAPSGIEPPVDAAPEAKRHFLAVAPEIAGRRVLLFYSRFHSKKRILELLRDFASIAPRLPDWHLLAVGIPDEYSVAELSAEARRLGIASRASILDGTTGPAPYAAAELFSLPTHDENFGRVVAEALAAGVPVITTTGTPWTEIDAAGAGRCVDIDAYRPTLEELMGRTSAELRAQGENGRRWVLQNFQWERSASTLKSFYQELLAGQAPARSAAG